MLVPSYIYYSYMAYNTYNYIYFAMYGYDVMCTIGNTCGKIYRFIRPKTKGVIEIKNEEWELV